MVFPVNRRVGSQAFEADQSPTERFRVVKPSPDLCSIVPQSICESPWIERLRAVSFLGAAGWHPECKVQSSRMDHTFAVAEYMLQIGRCAGLTDSDVQLLVLACLVHDIGHFPLSHSVEQGFVEATGVDHHEVARWIVLGDGAIPVERSLRPAIEQIGQDPDEIWSLISQDSAHQRLQSLSTLVVGRINVDTIEGINRVAVAFGSGRVEISPEAFVFKEGRFWICADYIDAIDRLWELKDSVYRKVINRPSIALVEGILSRAVCAEFDKQVFVDYEKFNDLALLATLSVAVPPDAFFIEADSRCCYRETSGKNCVERTQRAYWVDRSQFPTGAVPQESWGKRYRFRKYIEYLELDEAPYWKLLTS